jgi:hypothetical protein
MKTGPRVFKAILLILTSMVASLVVAVQFTSKA